MSPHKSAGAGSPVWFLCPVERQERNRAYDYQARTFTREVQRHAIEVTGRTRRYRPPRGSALGIRSSFFSREWRCLTCGKTGWSNHRDLLRQARKKYGDSVPYCRNPAHIDRPATRCIDGVDVCDECELGSFQASHRKERWR